MNKSILSALAAIAIALTPSCSSDEPIVESRNDNLEGDSYVSVNILSQNTGTRAEDAGFTSAADAENGLNENKIENALFIFYDLNGNFSQQKSRSLSGQVQSGNQNVEYISDATIVLQAKEIKPAMMLVIINPTSAFEQFAYGKSLAQVKKYTENFSPNENYSSFVMSNSVYKVTNDIIDVVPIADYIKDSQDKAIADPVNIYVERVNAKVTIETASSISYAKNTIMLVDGTNDQIESSKTLYPTIKGYALVNTADISYLVKNIDNLSLSWQWNTADYHRSFWANVPSLDLDPTFRYAEVLAANNPKFDNLFYPQENTSDTHTKLIVIAQLQDENGTSVPLVKYQGHYYTPENYLKLGAMAIKEAGLGDNVKVETYNDGLNSWETKIRLSDNSGIADDNAEKAQEILDLMDTALYWYDGQCYYFTDIEHFGSGDQAIGIVRNHYYAVSIDGISGLGVPVYGDEILEPASIDESYQFLSAKVNILAWKFVKQSVTLDVD